MYWNNYDINGIIFYLYFYLFVMIIFWLYFNLRYICWNIIFSLLLFAIDNCYIEGEQTSVKNSKEEEIKEYFSEKEKKELTMFDDVKKGEKLKLNKNWN